MLLLFRLLCLIFAFNFHVLLEGIKTLKNVNQVYALTLLISKQRSHISHITFFFITD